MRIIDDRAGNNARTQHQIKRSLGRIIRFAGSLVVCAMVAVAQAAQTVQVESFGANPGKLHMFEYVPDGLPAGAPLVVALHGCTQKAEDFDNETGWTDLADRLKFALLLPEQQQTNNDRLCFNWFSTDHNRRGRGEAASIKAMIDQMVKAHGIDPKRVFVTGLSAGGAMTAVMLAAYPEVFQAGAIIAGIPYGCASTDGDYFMELQKIAVVAQYGEVGWAAYHCGISVDPRVVRFATTSHLPGVWRDLLQEAGAPRPAAWPKVSLWQGKDDLTVDPVNLVELTDQWTSAHGLGQIPTTVQIKAIGTTRYVHKEYKDTRGDTQVETYEFSTLGHAVPINEGVGPGTCGRAAPYIVNVGVCGVSMISRFWGLGQ